MYSKPTMMFLCLVVSLISLPLIAAEETEPSRHPARQATVTMPSELSTLAEEMLKMVNEGRRPDKEEVAAVGALLLQNKKDFLKYDEPSKMKYSMLSAWNSYFAGDLDAAVQAIQAGLKSGPEDPDMKATYAAIAIAAEKYPLVGRLATQRRTTTRRRTGSEEEPEMQSSAPAGLLSFDAHNFKAQAVSKKIAFTDTALECVGGFTFNPSRFDVLCMLVYKTSGTSSSARTSQPSGEEDMSSRPAEGDPSSAFGDLMVEYADSGKVGFIGVSLDDADATYNAMRETKNKGWFWPQVMANKEANKALTELAKFSIDKPTLAIVTKDGTISYLGSPAGFIPRMLLAKATDNYTPKLYVAISPTDPNVRKTRGPVDPNMARRRPSDPNAPRGARDDAFGEAAEVQAQKLYETAKSFLRGKLTSPLTAGSGIQLCRQILERYPATTYAPKARELLRDLPDEIKKRYNITDAEMGL